MARPSVIRMGTPPEVILAEKGTAMTLTIDTATNRLPDNTCDPATSTTKSLLGYGVIAGPVYVVSVVSQALTRDGFDMSRHAASLLSNGDLGWIQISTFVVTGLMCVAASIGMSRAVTTGPGRTWGPRLVGLWGVGLVAAGAFRADPMDGFPVGTPDGVGALSWHGAAHMLAAMIGFFALLTACFVFARRFSTLGRRGWAAYSGATGVAFFAAMAAMAMSAGSSLAAIALWIAVVLAWIWLSALAVHLYRAVR